MELGRAVVVAAAAEVAVVVVVEAEEAAVAVGEGIAVVVVVVVAAAAAAVQFSSLAARGRSAPSCRSFELAFHHAHCAQHLLTHDNLPPTAAPRSLSMIGVSHKAINHPPTPRQNQVQNQEPEFTNSTSRF